MAIDDGVLRAAPSIEPFSKQKGGMILSKGAGAILLCGRGPAPIESHIRADILRSAPKGEF
jgi:hypothetical protein